MAIYLRPPQPSPSGPDGQGWNRLSLNAHTSVPAPQCTLRPRTYAALCDVRRGSRVTAWGPYGRCIRPAAWGDNSSPDCHACPILTAPPRELVTDADHVRVLDRLTGCTVGDGLFATQIEETLQLEQVDDAATTWTWAELARLPGLDIGRAVIDHECPVSGAPKQR